MHTLTEWIRSVLILYFLMMILLYFTAGESYKKFIRFFMGLVLALTLISPVLKLFGKTEALQEGIAFESFQQRMAEAQYDFGHLEDTESQMYRMHYEHALEEQFSKDAQERLLEIRSISVSLNEDYTLRQVEICEGLYGDGERLREYLVSTYDLQEGQVTVQ